MSKYSFGTKRPAPQPEVQAPVYNPSRREVRVSEPSRLGFWLLVASNLLFASLWVYAILPAGGDGDADTGEDTGGKYVAIFYDDKSMGRMTAAQREVVSGADVAQWIDENSDGYMVIDESQVDESDLPPPFDTLAAHHRSKLPWVIAAKGSSYISEPIESKDQTLGKIKKLFGK